MADPLTLRLWVGRSSYLALAILAIFVRLLPLGISPGDIPAPDLLLAATMAWVLRRPDQVPPLLIAGVFLTADMIFLRPPGLWTLLVLAAAEFLRARQSLVRELPLMLEWLMVSVLLLGAVLVESLVLSVFVVPRVALGVALLHMLVTLLAYPAVVAALWLVFGLRHTAPGEVDELGRRL